MSWPKIPFQGSVSGAWISAPATFDATSGGYSGGQFTLAAGATLTLAAGSAAAMPGGFSVRVGRSGTATTSVTLAASGVYALLPGDTADSWRLTGGAAT